MFTGYWGVYVFIPDNNHRNKLFVFLLANPAILFCDLQLRCKPLGDPRLNWYRVHVYHPMDGPPNKCNKIFGDES